MNHIVALSLTMAACMGLSGCSSDESLGVFRIDDSMLRPVPDNPHGVEQWSGTVVIGQGIVEPATFEVQQNGNGHLRICGQLFGVYDSHKDLDLFDPHCLHMTFVDLDHDGYRDLVLHGEIIETDDDDVFIRRLPLLLVYRYVVDGGKFESMPALKDGVAHGPSMLFE
ncbi:MAG: hypothetical protein H7210_07185 [Pyrinomonadaceae bacterium]|nr:hypothetical protein [Phycisphaerales bacterium]